jgi:hypothetical protein
VASAVPSPAAPKRRLWPLVRLYDGCLKSRLGAQLGKLLAALISVGHAIAVPFAARASSGDASDAVVVSALGWLTWTAAAALALSAVGHGSDEGPARDLAAYRGFSRGAMGFAELLSSGRRTLMVVGAPALLLALFAFAFARTPALLAARALLVLGVVGYVLVLAALVAVLVNLSRALGPERPRSALLALVVLPHLLHELFPRVPSVPALTGFLGAELLRVGAFFR